MDPMATSSEGQEHLAQTITLAILQLSYIGYAIGKVVANNVLLLGQ